MSNKDTITCWACDSIEESSLKTCSNCGMPLSQDDSSKEDLDNFLDEFSASDDTKLEGTELPEMNRSPTLPDFPDSPELPSFDESPSIPDPESPELPSFDESPSIPEFEIKGSTEVTQSPVIPDVSSSISPAEVSDELESPGLPSFDDFGLDAVDEVKEKDLEETQVHYTSIFELRLNRQLKLYLSLGFYWYIVFFIVSIASFEIIEPNVNIDSQNGGGILIGDYKIHPQAFLFAWISFIVMGWFFGYKLHQFGIPRTFKNGIFLLVIQFIVLSLLTIFGFIFINGSLANINLEESILLSLILFTWYNYVISMFTFGLLGYFASFGTYWNSIFKHTQKSKIST